MILSRVIEKNWIKQSPIRKIMEMATRSNIVKLGLNPDNVISFAGGWVNHQAPEELREEYIKIVSDKTLFHKVGEYSATDGDIGLKTMLTVMDKEIYGISGLSEGNIMIGQSSTELLYALLLALLDPEDKVMLFDPAYANYPEQIYICQRKSSIFRLKVFDSDSWTYIRDENALLSSLETAVREKRVKAILFSSPDNPTGQIPSDRFVEETLNIALEHGVFVLVDNAYRAQWFTESQPKQFSLSPNDFENLVTIHSNSKWCRGLGRRMGWIEASKSVMNAMKAIQQTIILCPDTLHQVAMANYLKVGLETGSLKRYLEENRIKYKNAAEFTSKCIEKYLGMRYLRPQGGLYTVVDVSTDGDQFIEDVLKNTGVIFVSGKGFGDSLTNGIRVSYGPLVNDPNKIETGFSRVRWFLNGSKVKTESIVCEEPI